MGWRGPRNQLGAGSKERLGTHSSMAESGMGARRPTGDLGIALPADFEENGTQFSEEHEQQMQRLALYRSTIAQSSRSSQPPFSNGYNVIDSEAERTAIEQSRIKDASEPASAADDNGIMNRGKASSPQRNHDTHDPLMYPGLYAPSGFDMLSILIRVMSRPNPIIDIGMVDSSCALVLCEARKPDLPIVYCSEPFTELTGYELHEIIGRNCRFLQSPDGVLERTMPRGPLPNSRTCEGGKVPDIEDDQKGDGKKRKRPGAEAADTRSSGSEIENPRQRRNSKSAGVDTFHSASSSISTLKNFDPTITNTQQQEANIQPKTDPYTPRYTGSQITAEEVASQDIKIRNLRQSLDKAEECQLTLINFKKGGERFINILTVVPIFWDDNGNGNGGGQGGNRGSTEAGVGKRGPDYFVGFQVDKGRVSGR